MTSLKERFTIQDRSEVLHPLQIIWVDFSVRAKRFQHLAPKPGEDIRMVGKHRHCERG